MIPFALPPAETRLPLSAVVRGFWPLEGDFSKKLGDYLGLGSGVLANNARSLLYLLFCVLREQSGKKEVLLPGYTCYSVAAAAVKAGLRISLYDMDTSSLQPDLEDVRRKIRPDTLAVVGQQLLGGKTDMAALTEIAHQHGVCCIDDSSQHLDPDAYDTPKGMRADFRLFSFGRGKSLPLGSGGGLFARDQEGLSRLVCKVEGFPSRRVNYLLPVAVQILSLPWLYWILEKLPLGLGRTIYDPGFKVARMPSFYQGVGTAVLDGLDCLNKHRVTISQCYDSHFSGRDEVESKRNIIPPYVRYPLLVQNQNKVSRLAKYGVRRLYPLALCDLPPLKGYLAECGEKTDGAREIARRLVTLPTHLGVDKKIAQNIVQEVSSQFIDIETINISM